MENIFQKALTFYKNNQLDLAEKSFRSILACDESHSNSLYFLGLIAIDKGAFDIAMDYFYKALLINPLNTDYIFSLAVALQETGRYEEALSYLEKINTMPEAQNSIGNIYRLKKDIKKSLQAFEKALKINNSFVWAKLNLALLKQDEGKTNEAIKLIEQLTVSSPDFAEAWHSLGVLYRSVGNVKKSILAHQKSLALTPLIAIFWNALGLSLVDDNQTSEAMDAYNKAISINHFFYEAYFNKAVLLEKLNRQNEAEIFYRNAIRGNKNFSNAYNNLGALLYKMGRVQEALECYRQVFIINPNHMESCFNLAIALEDIEEFEEAIGLYFNVLAHHQYQNIIHIRLTSAIPKLFLKDKEKALQYAKGWLKNFPDNPLAKHIFNALSGVIDEETAFAYTQSYYNTFADSYNDKMKELNCQVPSLIQSKLPHSCDLDILELGCGTGSCGIFLKPLAKKLIGVDISQKMLEKARITNFYTQLKQKEILDFFDSSSDLFNLIIAADVLCYIGDLKLLFQDVFSHLKRGGIFIFTVETQTNIHHFEITPFGRYVHQKEYIEKLLTTEGLCTQSTECVFLRKEGSTNARGYLFTAKKPT